MKFYVDFHLPTTEEHEISDLWGLSMTSAALIR